MKKVVSLVLCLLLCVGMLPMTAAAVRDDDAVKQPISFNENTNGDTGALTVTYLDENGESASADRYKRVTDDTTTLEAGQIYVVDGTKTVASKISVTGTGAVKLILKDKSTLKASGGIEVSGGVTLNIYACSTGADRGKLVVGSFSVGESFIGVYSIKGDSVGIYGGDISATASGGYTTYTIYSDSSFIVKNARLKLSASGGTSTGCIGGIGTKTFENADLTVDKSLNLTSGSFSKITVEGESMTLYNLLSLNDAFYKGDTVQNVQEVTTLENVTIKAHEHNYYKEVDSKEGRLYQCDCGVNNVKKSVTYIDYVDGKAVTKFLSTYNGLDGDGAYWKTGKTYVVTGNATFGTAVTTSVGSGDTIKLILCDGVELKLTKGLNMDNANLVIYGQSGGTGKLTISSDIAEPTIYDGGHGKTLTVNGGVVTVTAGNDRAIDVTDFVLNGGKVTATGGDNVSTSKALHADGNVTVNGGELTATGGKGTAQSHGISTNNYTQTGGTVTAAGGDITGDDAQSSCGLQISQNTTISGGALTATGGNITNRKENYVYSYGIWVNADDTYTTTVSGGTVTATGGNVTTSKTGGTAKSHGIQCANTMVFSGGSLTAAAGTTVADNQYRYPVSTVGLNASASGLTLPKDSFVGNITVSNDVKMKDLLDTDCAFLHYIVKWDTGIMGTVKEKDGFTSIADEPASLMGNPGDAYFDGYFVVAPCEEHSYVENACEYCGAAKKATGSGGYTPADTVTVTQPGVGGTVEVDNPAAAQGETVVVSPIPDNGYVIDTITVKDSDGNVVGIHRNNDGSFDFTQPAGNVTIEVTYTEQPHFADVKDGDWFHDAVDYAVLVGMMSGTGKTTFEPNEPMNRAMFATVLWCYAGKPNGFTGSFSDVEAEDWFKEAVAWASKNNVVSGTGNGKFEPDAEITREEMVVMLWNFCGKPEASSDELAFFTDGNLVSSWAKTAMSWAIENGIISGKGNDTLDPTGTATRAEAACILVNYCGSGF